MIKKELNTFNVTLGLIISLCLPALIFAQAPKEKITTHTLRYDNESVNLDIYNPGTQDCPVVILIHGAAGIEGDRALRYKKFAVDLMDEGIIAINVHYFDSKKENWASTIIYTINYAQTIPNADKSRIGLVGYSLGGTLALKVASIYNKVTLLAINAGFLPERFTKDDAARLPKTLIISGSKDKAVDTLYTLSNWLSELNKPFQTKINKGIGHDDVPLDVFKEDWEAIIIFLTNNFGLTQWQDQKIKIKLE
jgi:dienelactone hydrolase